MRGALVQLLLSASLVLSAPAGAHLMALRQATVNVKGDATFSALSLPASALRSADDDGDGLLSREELTRHEAALAAEVEQRWRLAAGGVSGQVQRVDFILQPPDDAPARPADHVVVLHHAQFDGPPAALTLDTDLFGTGAGDEAVTLVATRDGVRQRVTLSPPRAQLTLLGDSSVEATAVALAARGALGASALVAGLLAVAAWRWRRGALRLARASHHPVSAPPPREPS